MTKKKVTIIKDEEEIKEPKASPKKMTSDTVAEENPKKIFKPSDENKGQAKKLRIIALLLWGVAIGLEIVAIMRLRSTPINMPLMIGLLIGDAIFAIIGSILWKKANRLDPASEKDKVKFFIQNQLGMIIAIIAFLPLVFLLLTNKDLKGKDKGILSSVAVIALVVAVGFGIDLNPASVEKYTEEAALVETLMGADVVYWTKSGRVYHLYDDCYTINSSKTEEIFGGSVSKAYSLKNIEEICKICLKKAQVENGTAHVEDHSHTH